MSTNVGPRVVSMREVVRFHSPEPGQPTPPTPLPPVTTAQRRAAERRLQLRRAPTFRQVDTSRVRGELAVAKAPTRQEDAPGTTYVMLAPNQLAVEDKGKLSFFNPWLVDSSGASWIGKSAGATQLLIQIKPVVGRSYLITCAVRGDAVSRGFLLHGPGGIELSQFVDATGEPQHLIMTLEGATNADFHTFVVQFSPDDLQTTFFWDFFWCEVKNL